MYKGKISKLSRNENSLRTNTMEGWFESEPEVGKRFNITGESLTPGGTMRLITTSPVQSIETIDLGWEFRTENTKYRVITTR